MNPQSTSQHPNSLANWVNDAPTLEESAQRYDQILEGSINGSPAQFMPRTALHSR